MVGYTGLCAQEVPVRILLYTMVLGLLPAMMGCAGMAGSPAAVVVEEAPPELRTSRDGLRQKWVADASGYLFVKPPSVDLSRYNAYLLDKPKLHFVPLSGKPSRSEATRLSRAMARVLRPKLEQSLGWTEAQAAGPNVIRVSALVSNIEFSSPDVSSHTRTTALVSSSGMVVFTLEFRDSTTRELLARYGVRRPLPGGTYTGPSWHELDRARVVFRSFGIDLEPSLDALAQN